MALIRPRAGLMTRRSLLRRAGTTGAGLALGGALPPRAFAQSAPGVVTGERMRPSLPYGVQTGDVLGDRAILWARSDRPARMMVEWATTERFKHAKRITGPTALMDSDFTAKFDLAGLPAGQRIFYRVSMVDLAHHGLESEPVTGSFFSPPAARQPTRGAARSPLRVVGRHCGPGLGHQPRPRRYADLRGHASGGAGLLHPFR
jgi:alkaline phosphatase D